MLIVALAGLVIGWIGWRWIDVPVPLRAYERIRLGMTREEVETAIGREPYRGVILSPGFLHYVRETGLPAASIRHPAERSAELTVETWTWDESWIVVAFDDGGKAVGFYLLESARQPPSLLERLTKWVGM
jgi:hypothetical protein